VTKSQYPYLVARHNEAIECNVSGGAIRDHEFPEFAGDPAPGERMRGQMLDRGTDGGDGVDGGARILSAQKTEGSLDVPQRPA